MKVSILTLGCKVNQAESAFIEGNLLHRGFSIVDLSQKPDYCVVNTCTVTAKSDYQSRQLLRRAVRAGSKVIVTGCYSQLRRDEIAGIEGDIEIVDNINKLSILNILSGNPKGLTLGFSCRSRPYVKVQDGCNSACTYCIVPKARGKSRSVEVSDILDHASQLEARGYHEIVLTGIHLGSYGKDLDPKLKLSYLVETLLNKTTIHRIRLSSIEVNEIDDDLLALLKEERICSHIHVPLQSGDDTVLALMQRKYRSRDYRAVIESVASRAPGAAIGTDVIVGFPGEGDKEFSNTKNMVDGLPLAYMHIFPFSSRPGTVASAMPGQVSSPIKKQRWAELNEINLRKKAIYMSSQANRVLDVVVEENCDGQTVIGTSGNYLRIMVCAERYPKKSLVYVRVAGSERNMLKGYPIEKL